MTNEMKQVLKTTMKVYSWVLTCTDPPPMSLIGEMGEAAEIARQALLNEPLEESGPDLRTR